MAKTALITGINGFVGTHLARHLLDDGCHVAGVVRTGRDCASGLLAEEDIHPTPATTPEAIALLDRVRPDAIFHLATATASEQAEDLDTMLATNVALGAGLLEAASRMAAKPAFIAAGSFWEYSSGPAYCPNTLYAATKHCLYDLLVYYRDRRQLCAVSLVLFDTYGPDDRRGKLWNKLLEAAPGAGMAMTAGEQLIELVHVRDVAAAFVRAAQLLATGQLPKAAYAVRSDRRASLRSTVEQICRQMDKGLVLDWGAFPFRDIEVFDPWNGPLLPGWLPHVTIEEGFRELMDFANAGPVQDDPVQIADAPLTYVMP